MYMELHINSFERGKPSFDRKYTDVYHLDYVRSRFFLPFEVLPKVRNTEQYRIEEHCRKELAG